MSKSTKKSKGGVTSTKAGGFFGEEDKGPHAVILADLQTNRFEPLTRNTPHCLLPLAGVPLLHYSLSRLIADGFKNITIYACAHTNQVQQFVHCFQAEGRVKETRITVCNGENCRSLGDVMRDLDSSQTLRGVSDFLLVPADLICAQSLLPFVRQHEARRARSPATILSLVMPHASKLATPAQAAEWAVSVLLSPTMDNRILKLFPACVNPTPNILLQELIRSDQRIELSSDLFDLGVAVCSNHIAPLFQDNFDYQTMGDLIHDVLTNEEVMGYTMHVDRVPAGPMMVCAAPDLNTLIHFAPCVLMRDSGVALPLCDMQPASVEQDAWISQGPQTYVARSARIDPGVQLIGSCLIGAGCHIGAGSVLIDCVLGSDCHVGKRARLRRVVALDSVQIGDRVRADTAWICSQAVILTGMRLPTQCFIGPSEHESHVTLGPGPGQLSPRTVIVTPGQSDIILDPAVGGAQVWASLWTGKSRSSDQMSSDGYSDDSSNEAPNASDQRRSATCTLWDTAEDRVRAAMAKLRRSNVRTRGQSSASEAMATSHVHQRRPSGKLTRKSGRTVSTAGTDIDRPSEASGDEIEEDDDGEQSEAFLVGELRHTLEHSQSGDSAAENVILEVNSLKHAYNIMIDDLYFLLTKAILDVTRTRCPNANTRPAEAGAEVDHRAEVRAFVSEFKTQLSRFQAVLHSYFGQSGQASRMCVQALEDSACYNPLLMDASPYLMHALYDADLITEEAIWWWAEHSPLLADDELAERTKLMREKLKPFLSWLREAESEEEEDEDSDD